jgi:hypothetical protein
MQCPQQISVKATAAIPRREARSSVPAIGGAIKADCLEGSTAHGGRLWDGSPSDPLTMPIAARLTWVDVLARATYAGFEFLERNDFSNTSLRLVIRG